MKKFIYRMTGIFLIIAAVLGWGVSVGGAVLAWKVKPAAESALLSSVDLLDRSLAISNDMLGVADTSLEQAEKSVTLLGATIDDVADTLQTTSEMTASIAGIFGDSLGSVVSKTQQALGTMEASAKLVDDTLGFISAIPFMRIDYDPNMPLAASVADISDSLDPLPENLTAVQGDMENTSENLGSMDKNISGLQESILGTQKNLQDARGIVQSYQEVLEETQQKIANFRDKLPFWMNVTVWGLTIFFVWLVIAQAGLLMQGLEMLQRDRMAPPPPAEEESADGQL